MSKKLFEVKFNDFGCDYVVARDWKEAGEVICDFYGDDTNIKEFKELAVVATTKEDTAGQKVHL